MARTPTPVSTPAEEVNAIFTALQNTMPESMTRFSTCRMRQKIRNYSPKIMMCSLLSSTSSGSRPSTSGEPSEKDPKLPPLYSNWVFITSADVLSRAGEDSDCEGNGDEKEGEDGVPTGELASGETRVSVQKRSGWTKRQYREEGEKLRGKEWVFR